MADIVDEVRRLKAERNAIILAHNYQLPEIQDIADYLGDSLALSRTAAKTDADVIVLCGVHFMAETAAILSPDKKVLLPDLDAGCPMADTLTAERLRELKKKHPKAVVVCYVNTSAAVKAESDICCTSSNAVEVVESLEEDEIIFVPDMYLADYISRKTGRELIVWEGCCPTHAGIKPGDVLRQKRLHPRSEVIVHPECMPEVIDLADEVLSTEGMCTHVKKTDTREFIIGTDPGILHRLRKENPTKSFYAASEESLCSDMKIITLKKVLHSLREMEYMVEVPEDVRVKAKQALDRMLEIG
ncbi:MAG: quinolinate synthase NadA [Candidatus Altiarchaeota archaeon]|nr:quinolinate synthase NadA [Candidatus Altiarchaeota archaeon]